MSDFWEHVERTAELVKHWPIWAGGGGVEPITCPQCNRPLAASQPPALPPSDDVHHSFDEFSPTQDCSCGWKAPQAYRSTVDGAKSQWEKHVLLVTTEYTEREEAAIAEMMKLLDVSRKVILRGALAAYQLQVKGAPALPPALVKEGVLQELTNAVENFTGSRSTKAKVEAALAKARSALTNEQAVAIPASTPQPLQGVKEGEPLTVNQKWLLGAAGQVVKELVEQEHLDWDTFAWLKKAIYDVEKDAAKPAASEEKP